MMTGKYSYDMPPMITWNIIELKICIKEISLEFGISGNLDIDNGHSFSYSITVFFPSKFNQQAIMNKFAPYDAIPEVIDQDEILKNQQVSASEPNSEKL
jgi:hypothetical protein